eukprot:1359842-Amphidinium_carterae.1
MVWCAFWLGLLRAPKLRALTSGLGSDRTEKNTLCYNQHIACTGQLCCQAHNRPPPAIRPHPVRTSNTSWDGLTQAGTVIANDDGNGNDSYSCWGVAWHPWCTLPKYRKRHILRRPGHMTMKQSQSLTGQRDHTLMR